MNRLAVARLIAEHPNVVIHILEELATVDAMSDLFGCFHAAERLDAEQLNQSRSAFDKAVTHITMLHTLVEAAQQEDSHAYRIAS